MATGGDKDDRTIILRDAATGMPLAEPLLGHTSAVTSLAFSPDGKLLASGGGYSEGKVILWDLTTREALGSLLDDGAVNWIVADVAFSPDGRILASAGCSHKDESLCDRGEIRLWDVATRQLISSPLVGHDGGVSRIVFGPHGDTLITGDDSPNPTIIVWDVASQNQIGEPFEADWPGVSSLALSPDGTILASGSSINETIVLWDVAKRERIGALVDRPAAILTFSQDGGMLAAGSLDGLASLWDVSTAQLIGPPLEVGGRVEGLAFSRDGELLLSVGSDGAVVRRRLDIGSWKARACRIANRNLSPEEWNQYIGGNYRETCEDLP
jgi:WD40 repeat protein